MKATGRFCTKLAGLGSATFLYLILASTLSTSGLLLAQSVKFAGTTTTLPFSSIQPSSVAVDSAGNVFIVDSNTSVVELPKTANGYGPQTTLPFSGLSNVWGVAVDSAGDVFVTEFSPALIVELPWTGTGYGPQTTLPSNNLEYLAGIAIDSTGDVFVTEFDNGELLELPWTETGYGPEWPLGFRNLSYPGGIAVDSTGDLFVTDAYIYNRVVELHSGEPEVTLPATGLKNPFGVALDRAGDVFIADYGNNRVVELPRTPTGYATQTTLPSSGLHGPWGVAVDNTGNVLISGGSRVIVNDLHTGPVEFAGAHVCAPGATTPAPCSQMLALNYRVNADATLGVPEVHTGGLPGLDFKRASGSTCIGAVTAGSICTVNVEFAPLSAGFRYGSVQITDNGTVIAATQISGFGIGTTTGPPVAQVSTAYLPFGTIPFGTSKTLPVTVTNIGGGTLTVATAFGTGSSNFGIAANTCGKGVQSGASCTLVVDFSPTTAATHYNLLTIQTNGGNPTVTLDGSGSGLSIFEGANYWQFDFGVVASGSTEVQLLTITNVGLPGTVTIQTAITVRATTRPTATYTVLNTADNTCLAGIAAGQSCNLPIEFAPTSSGIHDDLLTLTPSGGGVSTEVWLNGSTP